MNKDRKKLLFYVRYTLSVIGVLLLVSSIFELIRISRSDELSSSVQSPTMVSHRVLFLCSYNSLYFTYNDQIEGLKETLYPNGIEFDVIYMDTKKYGSEHDIEMFHTIFKDRLKKDNDYEAVLLGDDDAVKFALKYQDELFKDLPMVFFGVNDKDFAEEAAKNPMMTGFYEMDYLSDCIDLAVALFPERKELVALHDNSAAGIADEEIFYSLDLEYPGYKFTDINSALLTQDELVAALQGISSDDAVLLYMTCYSDCEGKTYSVLDRTNTVVKYADVPIIRNYSGGREQGVLGGVYMDFRHQCRDAALIIVDILENGADISNYALDLDTPSKSVFSYPLMQEYGISKKQLPISTEYIGEPENLFTYYSKVLPAAVMIVTALLILIVTSNMAVSQQRIDNEQLKRSKEDLEKSRNRLKYQADHDELSDLLNRRAIVDTLARKVKSGDKYAIVMVDIDGFKDVNENYGHSMADYIIKHLSKELKEMSERGNWLTGRYGGDEFIIMIPNVNLDTDSAEVIQILEAFRKPIVVGEETILLSASIGVSNSNFENLPEQHIINAEIAMYEAKNMGRNTAFIYADEMQLRLREESRLKNLVIEAFDRDQFYIMYQPKVETLTGKVVGFEALVRAEFIQEGPGVFIPIVEKNGWVTRLGRIVTEKVIKQLAVWKAQGKELLPVSINFSSKQVNDLGYVSFLSDLLKEYDIPAKYIEIEITESLLLEKSIQSDRLFAELKGLGIRILMDDFGTGYSSLGYLIYVPVDEIKLDKSLVDNYLVPEKDGFIGDVIKLVHDINKTIIIEGVEEEWQFKRLCDFQADAVQGYYFSKPLDPSSAIDFRVETD